MPGGNLHDLLNVSHSNDAIPVTPLLQLRLCDDISNGIAYIHDLYPAAKLVHGDLKPENILLSKNLTCKIADFGGSRLSAASESMASVVNRMQISNQEHVTLLYTAPEVLINPRSNKLMHTHDIFSFSIIVFEILTRTKPNQKYAACKGLYEDDIKKGGRPNLSELGAIEEYLSHIGSNFDAHIRSTLREVMVKCWSHDPSCRPEMSTVHANLSKLLFSFTMQDQEKAVQTALAKMEIWDPSTKRSETIPIDRVLTQGGRRQGTMLIVLKGAKLHPTRIMSQKKD